jgi:transposase
VISGILHALKGRCRWCDCPTDYGPSTTVYSRFNRWSNRGFWLNLLDGLVDTGVVTKSAAINGTYVKAQRAAFGEKWGGWRRRSAARVAAGRPKSMRSRETGVIPVHPWSPQPQAHHPLRQAALPWMPPH